MEPLMLAMLTKNGQNWQLSVRGHRAARRLRSRASSRDRLALRVPTLSRQQSQRIPPLAAPALGDPPALQHDVLDAALREAVAHRQSSLAGADDGDWDVIHGLFPELRSPAVAAPMASRTSSQEDTTAGNVCEIAQTSISIVTGTCPVRMSNTAERARA
jgi:hypothetical protein